MQEAEQKQFTQLVGCAQYHPSDGIVRSTEGLLRRALSVKSRTTGKATLSLRYCRTCLPICVLPVQVHPKGRDVLGQKALPCSHRKEVVRCQSS